MLEWLSTGVSSRLGHPVRARLTNDLGGSGMAISTLNMENINSSIESNDILIIDFWASWCGPCMAFKPI